MCCSRQAHPSPSDGFFEITSASATSWPRGSSDVGNSGDGGWAMLTGCCGRLEGAASLSPLSTRGSRPGCQQRPVTRPGWHPSLKTSAQDVPKTVLGQNAVSTETGKRIPKAEATIPVNQGSSSHRLPGGLWRRRGARCTLTGYGALHSEGAALIPLPRSPLTIRPMVAKDGQLPPCVRQQGRLRTHPGGPQIFTPIIR